MCQKPSHQILEIKFSCRDRVPRTENGGGEVALDLEIGTEIERKDGVGLEIEIEIERGAGEAEVDLDRALPDAGNKMTTIKKKTGTWKW